jgi:O-antigen ligase
MSRFKNTPKPVAASTMATSRVHNPRAPLFAPAPFRQVQPKTFQPLPVNDGGSPSIVASVGFFLYCAYVLSGFANDWAMKLMGNKAYISTIALVLLPVAWLLSGSAFRGLQRPMGLWWAGFLVCLLVSAPFSVWKGGSATLLWNYVPRNYLAFFYICAFATSLRRCRDLMYVNAAGAVVLLLTCVKFGAAGSAEGGRFEIPESLFYGNANDLGLALLLGVTSFLYLIFQAGIPMRILGAGGILLCVLYALKTGSRGCMLAAVAMLLLIFLFSRNKLTTAMFALPIIGLSMLVLPSATVHRLLLFGMDSSELQAQSESDVAAIGSQVQRQELFKKSLYYTVTHPLLGVGPDQFAVAVAGDSAKQGVHSPWLGTHNSYTQVSSECGIPAFICYCAVLVLSFKSNWRLYRQCQDDPVLKDVANLSFCLLAAILVYAVSTFFFHIAYGGGLPTLAGFSLALQLAAEPLLDGRTVARPAEYVVA